MPHMAHFPLALPLRPDIAAWGWRCNFGGWGEVAGGRWERVVGVVPGRVGVGALTGLRPVCRRDAGAPRGARGGGAAVRDIMP